MAELFTALWQDESGQDMAEYGLLLALIAVVVTAAVVLFRDAIVDQFDAATAALNSS